MNEHDLQELLFDVLFELMSAREDEEDPLNDLGQRTEGMHRLETFEEAGMLTTDNGLVIHMHDGHEYQLPIVRCR